MTHAKTVFSHLARLALGVALVAVIGGCAQVPAKLADAAGRGQIDQDAPVKAELTVQIGAPIATVWSLLVHAEAWPAWNSAISSVNADGALQAGSRFRWKVNGLPVQSQVQLCDPPHRLSWTGTAFTAQAIHVWELTSIGEQQTQVRVKESMDGLLMKQLFSSAKLASSDKDWLDALKTAAEHKAQSAASRPRPSTYESRTQPEVTLAKTQEPTDEARR